MKTIVIYKLLNVSNSIVYRIGLVIQFIEERPVLKQLLEFAIDRLVEEYVG